MAGTKITRYAKNTQANKYRNQKVKTEEGVFDSKKEYARWLVLKDMESIGLIKGLKRQCKFELIPKQVLEVPRMKKGGKMQRSELPVTYTADFVYVENGKVIVEDTKGMKTEKYIIKRKLMMYLKGIEIREV